MRQLVACGYVCAAVLILGAPLLAQDTTTGMVGVSNNQAVRLNVLNVSPASSTTATIAAVCAVQLQLIDGGGTVLKQASMGVAAGKVAAIELRREDIASATSARVQLRGQVNTVPAAAGTTAASSVCNLISTLEVFDEASGDTQVVLGGGHALPAATPAPGSN
jgi:hypothetical protein